MHFSSTIVLLWLDNLLPLSFCICKLESVIWLNWHQTGVFCKTSELCTWETILIHFRLTYWPDIWASPLCFKSRISGVASSLHMYGNTIMGDLLCLSVFLLANFFWSCLICPLLLAFCDLFSFQVLSQGSFLIHCYFVAWDCSIVSVHWMYHKKMVISILNSSCWTVHIVFLCNSSVSFNYLG